MRGLMTKVVGRGYVNRALPLLLGMAIAGVGLGSLGCGGGSAQMNPEDGGVEPDLVTSAPVSSDLGAPMSPLIGTWTGNLVSQPVTCSDGQVVQSVTNNVTITIMAGSGGQVFWHAQCADIYVDASGNAGTQSRDVTCAPHTNSDGTLVNTTFKNATLVANGSALAVQFTALYGFTTSAGTAVCEVPTSGTLIKK